MSDPGASSAIITGSPTPVDATCLECRAEGLHHVVLYVLALDGPRRVGETTFCLCQTRPARGTLAPGIPRRTGDRCVRCAGDALYEVPFYTVTAAGVTPHATRLVCHDCDARAAS